MNKSFLKDNFVVVLGVALPLALMAFLALARGISEATVAPPESRAVYAQLSGSPYAGQFHYSLTPQGGLRITYERKGTWNAQTLPQQPLPVTVNVYVGNLKTGAVTHATYTVPNAYAQSPMVIDASDLNAKITALGPEAPDGYVYAGKTDHYYSGDFFPDLFWGYGHRYNSGRYSVSKNGRSFALETANDYEPVEFIGWAKE